MENSENENVLITGSEEVGLAKCCLETSCQWEVLLMVQFVTVCAVGEVSEK